MYSILAGINKEKHHVRKQEKAIIELKEEGLDVAVHLLHVFNEDYDAGVAGLESTKTIQSGLEDHGIKVSLHEDTGNPARQIVALAQELDTDAICVAGRKKSPTGKVIFGSIIQAVLLSSDRPVIVPSVEE